MSEYGVSPVDGQTETPPVQKPIGQLKIEGEVFEFYVEDSDNLNLMLKTPRYAEPVPITATEPQVISGQVAGNARYNELGLKLTKIFEANGLSGEYDQIFDRYLQELDGMVAAYEAKVRREHNV